jgi:uncharacterized Zn-finger protein
MRIIKSPREVHCDRCGCIYEFDAEDVIKTFGDSYVLCPICSKKHRLKNPYDYY